MLRGHAEPRRFSLGSTGSAVQILRGPECQAGGSTPPPERDEAGDEQGAEQGTLRNARTWGFERACLLEVLTCCTISSSVTLQREIVHFLDMFFSKYARVDSKNDVKCLAAERLGYVFIYTR